ncbi:hypothetical protein EBT31_01740 [bacterium]|nr:hypothetical protein [bacterium]NBX49992.1 hypothetical protein [bacterium]
MAFPSLRPTSRDFSAGDWPVKRYNAQSGAEVRILYGSQRTNAKLRLGYENITDVNAQLFLDDYAAQLGTLRTFDIPTTAQTGWTGSSSALNAPPGTKWRYESEPTVVSVRPGRSSVTVNLVAVI